FFRIIFFFNLSFDLFNLYSFPTRRSSDLDLNEAFHSEMVRLAKNQMLRSTLDRVISLPFASPSALLFARSKLPKSSEIHTIGQRSEEHTSELQSPYDLVCRLLLEKKNNNSFGSLSTTASAIACSILNLPAFGDETISARWPNPTEQTRPKTRMTSEEH